MTDQCGVCGAWFPGIEALRDHYPCVPGQQPVAAGRPDPVVVPAVAHRRYDPLIEALSDLGSDDEDEDQSAAYGNPLRGGVQPVPPDVPGPLFTLSELQPRTFSVSMQQEFGFVSSTITNFANLATTDRRTFLTWDSPVPRCFFLSNANTAKNSSGTPLLQRQLGHGFLLLRNYTIYPPDRQNHEVVGRLNRLLHALKENVLAYIKGIIAKHLAVAIRNDPRLINPLTLQRFPNASELRAFLRSPDASERFEAGVKDILDDDLIPGHLHVRRAMASMLMKRYGFCKHPRNDDAYNESCGSSFQSVINDALTSFRSSFLRVLRDKKIKYQFQFLQLDTENHVGGRRRHPTISQEGGPPCRRSDHQHSTPLPLELTPHYVPSPTVAPGQYPWVVSSHKRDKSIGGTGYRPLTSDHDSIATFPTGLHNAEDGEAEQSDSARVAARHCDPARVDAILKDVGIGREQLLALLGVLDPASKKTNDLSHPHAHELEVPSRQKTAELMGLLGPQENGKKDTPFSSEEGDATDGAANKEAADTNKSDSEDTVSESTPYGPREASTTIEQQQTGRSASTGPANRNPVSLSVATGRLSQTNGTATTTSRKKHSLPTSKGVPGGTAPKRPKKNKKLSPKSVVDTVNPHQDADSHPRKDDPPPAPFEVPGAVDPPADPTTILAAAAAPSEVPVAVDPPADQTTIVVAVDTQLAGATHLQESTSPTAPTALGINYRCEKHGVVLSKYQKLSARNLKYYSNPDRFLCKAVCQGNYRLRDGAGNVVPALTETNADGTLRMVEPERSVCFATAVEAKEFAIGKGLDAVCFHYCGPCQQEYAKLDEEDLSKVAVLCIRCYEDYEEENNARAPTGHNTCRERKQKQR